MKKKVFGVCLVFVFFCSAVIYAQKENAPDALEVAQKLFERGVVDETKKPMVGAVWISPEFYVKLFNFLGTSSNSDVSKGFEDFNDLADSSFVLIIVFSEEKLHEPESNAYFLETNTGIKLKPYSGFDKDIGFFNLLSDNWGWRMFVFPVCKSGECLFSKDVNEVTMHIAGESGSERTVSWAIQRTDGTAHIASKGQSFMEWAKQKGQDKEVYSHLMKLRDKVKITEALISMGTLRKTMEMYAADSDTGVYPSLREDCSNVAEFLGKYTNMEKTLGAFDGGKLVYCAVKEGKSYLLKARAKDSHKTAVKATQDSVDRDD